MPAKVAKPGGTMMQLSETQSEFTVPLQGPALPATLKDLSTMPLQDWMAIMFVSFAEAKAAIGILVTHGRVSVTLHEGD